MEKTSRRYFMKVTAAAGGVASVMSVSKLFAQSVAPVKPYIYMIKLPYANDALQPYLSEMTVTQHYNKHHMSYYERLVGYIKANPSYDKIPLDDLIRKTQGGILLEDALFNIAVLLWNHNFYWPGMKPDGGIPKTHSGRLHKQLIASFGSVEAFKKKFTQRCMETGIGWVWLIKTPAGLDIVKTEYHDNLVYTQYPPMFTIDVWEHAYYMDYGFDREKYVTDFLNHLVNWEFAEANFKKHPALESKPKEEVKTKKK